MVAYLEGNLGRVLMPVQQSPTCQSKVEPWPRSCVWHGIWLSVHSRWVTASSARGSNQRRRKHS